MFGAKYANVQPHSGTTANQIVITALLEHGDKILSMATSHGGHFSHGSIDSITAKFFEIESYHVDRDTFLLDYDQIQKQAQAFQAQTDYMRRKRISENNRFRKLQANSR